MKLLPELTGMESTLTTLVSSSNWSEWRRPKVFSGLGIGAKSCDDPWRGRPWASTNERVTQAIPERRRRGREGGREVLKHQQVHIFSSDTWILMVISLSLFCFALPRQQITSTCPHQNFFYTSNITNYQTSVSVFFFFVYEWGSS